MNVRRSHHDVVVVGARCAGAATAHAARPGRPRRGRGRPVAADPRQQLDPLPRPRRHRPAEPLGAARRRRRHGRTRDPLGVLPPGRRGRTPYGQGPGGRRLPARAAPLRARRAARERRGPLRRTADHRHDRHGRAPRLERPRERRRRTRRGRHHTAPVRPAGRRSGRRALGDGEARRRRDRGAVRAERRDASTRTSAACRGTASSSTTASGRSPASSRPTTARPASG